MQLFLIIGPDSEIAEELAGRLVGGDDTLAVTAMIMAVPNGAGPGDILQQAADWIVNHGKPKAIFMASEFPQWDARQMLDIVKDLGKQATIVLFGRNYMEISDAAMMAGGIHRYVTSFLANPPTPQGLLDALKRIREANQKRVRGGSGAVVLPPHGHARQS